MDCQASWTVALVAKFDAIVKREAHRRAKIAVLISCDLGCNFREKSWIIRSATAIKNRRVLSHETGCPSNTRPKRKASEMTECQLREKICELARSMFERGLTPGSSGNISARLDDDGWLMTPTDSSMGFLDPAKISKLDANANWVAGDRPTKEVALHTALYETRHGARAVVHLHSTHSVAVSLLPEIDPRAVLPPLTPYYLMRVGNTALVPYHRPGDTAVVGAIKGLTGRYSSVLLANHRSQKSGSRSLRYGGTGRDRETVPSAARTQPKNSIRIGNP